MEVMQELVAAGLLSIRGAGATLAVILPQTPDKPLSLVYALRSICANRAATSTANPDKSTDVACTPGPNSPCTA